jgi:hypothetical protein
LPHEKPLIQSKHLHWLVYDPEQDLLQVEGLNAISLHNKSGNTPNARLRRGTE